ncbi:TolC family protein [Paramagnetospirillum kuznetsovii]|uniref:TolC family protein n=1 Tax=Paramagnetospirillum kuznetsovii TaxID=2053833 RepID=A0A364NTD1_9PROT|nr:TolC family protein [Paramagnetospirillum kuznetsovii]RAU20270.1 TolC family protein [Paramagnetospirillum kuznetsovii]
MRSYRLLRHLLASASVVALLSACAVSPNPLTEAEMKAQTVADKAEMFSADAPVTKPLSLSDAIARALTQNLDRRTKVMEEALAAGQKNVDRWDLLPKMVANAGYTGRSEANATRSRDAVTNVTSTSNPTYSTDRDNITADLGLTWNILDFGVSYVNAQQSADKALIATERRRKTVHNLIQEVRFAYWRTAAAQVLHAEVSNTVQVAEKALTDARAVEREGLRSQAEILRYQKNLLENLRQLEAISHELSTARYELAALVNLPPGSEMNLDIPADSAMTIPPMEMSPEQMEELAFVNNPDLREQMYLARITLDETKKTILKMLPGINLNINNKWDSNSFLVDHQWYEVGSKITWNLFNLLSAPDQMDSAEANEKVANAKRVALRMAILAQVHVSYRQFQNAGKQFQRADELYQVEQRLAQFARVRSENDAQSVMERIANQTSAIAARLRRYQSYAQMQSAFGKMQATLGQDLLPDQVASHDIDDLSNTINARLETWGRLPTAPIPVVDAAPEALAPVPVAEMPVQAPVVESTPDQSVTVQPVAATQDGPVVKAKTKKVAVVRRKAAVTSVDLTAVEQQAVKSDRNWNDVPDQSARLREVSQPADDAERSANVAATWVRPGLDEGKVSEILVKASQGRQTQSPAAAPAKDKDVLRYDLPAASEDGPIAIASSAN